MNKLWIAFWSVFLGGAISEGKGYATVACFILVILGFTAAEASRVSGKEENK